MAIPRIFVGNAWVCSGSDDGVRLSLISRDRDEGGNGRYKGGDYAGEERCFHDVLLYSDNDSAEICDSKSRTAEGWSV